MTVELRDYQKEAIESIYSYFDRGEGTKPLVSAPTGSGKSIIMGQFIKEVCTENPRVRVMVITDSRDLIAQNEKQLRNIWPEAKTGIYSAGLGKRQSDENIRVLFCGIQSVSKKAFDLGKFDIIIIDECHLVGRDSETRYRRFLKDELVVNPHVVVIGFSATIYRLDSGMLYDGKDALFDGVAYVCDMKRLIKEGYLCPVVSKGGSKTIDLTNVKIQAGEFNQKDLAFAADNDELIKHAVKEIVECGKDRRAWIVFASGIDHAEHVAREIRKYKIECEVVTGNTPNEERDRIIEKFKSGNLRCMVNVGIFTKGFDAPICDLVALLMATKSTARYVQIVGRAMRPCPPSKRDALILDFGNNVLTHGLIDEVDPIKKKDVFGLEPAKPPMKECPNLKCRAIIHARVMKCPSCGYEFPLPEAEAKHGTEAYSGPVTSDQITPFLVNVKDIWVSKHAKPGKTPSVKIAFYDGMDKEYPVWACVQHGGYAGEKGRALIKQLGGTKFTVDEIVKDYHNWKKVEKIEVRMEKKWPRVTGFVFAKNQSTQQKLAG
jgi:DNA repair protein RadD